MDLQIDHSQAPQSTSNPQKPATAELVTDPYYADIDEPDEPEIVEGILREGQLASLGGSFGMGKTPFLTDLTSCLVHGLPFCGRATAPRPVVYFNLESKGKIFRRDLSRSALRRGVQPPTQPDQLEAYIEADKDDKPGTKELRELLAKSNGEKLDFIKAALARKPNALVIIDPLERLFPIDTNKKQQVMTLYSGLRRLLAKFPQAAFLMTFNLRKKGREGRADLLTDPRNWLEEVSGTLDIHNRADVRLGMDSYAGDEEVRVINGIRRGEEMHPLLIRSVADSAGKLAGFEPCMLDSISIGAALTTAQYGYWCNLPDKFRFDDVADKIVPRSSLSRLLKRAKSLGIIVEEDGLYSK